MIIVIVDTTATFVDVMMKSTRWMQLLTLCHNSTLQVVLPDVVLRETARHWETEAAKAIDIANGKIGGINASRDRLTDLGIDASSLIESTPVTATPERGSFEERQREKLVSLGIQVKKVPDHVDVEMILQRDLARKKPFADSGKGFRDALVWETVVDVLANSDASDQVFFVTNNSNDYCDSSGALLPQLLAEVQHADGELIRVADLDELLEHVQLAPQVASLARTDEQLATFLATAAGEEESRALPVGEVVKNAVMHALEDLAGEEVETSNDATSGLDFTALNIPSHLEGLSIDVIEPDEFTLTWQTYETYDDTTYLIQAEIHASVSLVGFAYKGDAISLEEEKQVHILEFDWNDHMSHVATSTEAKLTFQMQLEQGMNFVEQCELEAAEPVCYDSENRYQNA